VLGRNVLDIVTTSHPPDFRAALHSEGSSAQTKTGLPSVSSAMPTGVAIQLGQVVSKSTHPVPCWYRIKPSALLRTIVPKAR